MPFPVISGIPWLAGVIGGFFAAVFKGLVERVTKRIALVGAALVVVVSTTAVFFVAIESIIRGIDAALPPQFGQAAGLFLPSNTVPCIVALLTALALRWAYEWNVKIIQWKLF